MPVSILDYATVFVNTSAGRFSVLDHNSAQRARMLRPSPFDPFDDAMNYNKFADTRLTSKCSTLGLGDGIKAWLRLLL